MFASNDTAALDYDPDLRSEIERKGLLDEIETSYVPQTGVAFSMGRRKRDVAFGGDNRWHGSRVRKREKAKRKINKMMYSSYNVRCTRYLINRSPRAIVID